MAAPLQRSGEYDFRMSPSALDQWWTLRTLVMSLCRLCPHSSHPSNLQDKDISPASHIHMAEQRAEGRYGS